MKDIKTFLNKWLASNGIIILKGAALLGIIHFAIALFWWSFYVTCHLKFQSMDWIMLFHASPSLVFLSGFIVVLYYAKRKTKTALRIFIGCVLLCGADFYIETTFDLYQDARSLLHYKKIWSYITIGDIQHYCNWWWYEERVPCDGIEDPNLNYRYGYIDKKGNIIIEAKYESAGDFSEELADVKQNSKYGYIDTSENVAIPFNYDDATPFHEDLAGVKVGDEYVFIDKTGKTVFDQKFEYTKGFSEGLAVVEIGDKWGYINKQGVVVIEPNYDTANTFHEGLAPVRQKPSSGYLNKGQAPIKKETLYGYINNKGEYVIEPKFTDASSFSEGLASVECSDSMGYINKSGEWIITPRYRWAWSFSDGLACVADIKNKWGYREKYGYHFIDQKGIIQQQIDYQTCPDFSEGLTPVYIHNKAGFVNKDGQIVIDPKFDSVRSFKNGLAVYGMKVKQEKKR